jgi:hypothetical protein
MNPPPARQPPTPRKGRRLGAAAAPTAPAAEAAPAPQTAQAAPAAQATAARQSRVTTKALAEVTTRLWRARRHAQRLADDTDPALQGAGVRPLLRELDAALAGLTDAGVVVQDHDGDLFDPGLALLAVAFQPTPGLTREQVLETLRPSIYLGELHLQRGEVVVGVPRPHEQIEPDRQIQPHESKESPDGC